MELLFIKFLDNDYYLTEDDLNLINQLLNRLHTANQVEATLGESSEPLSEGKPFITEDHPENCYCPLCTD
jgi:hypothetical protein